MDAVDPHQDFPADEFVVLATLESRRSAEHMVASLGGKFRRLARRGAASTMVVSANRDGSLKLTLSRAQTAGDVAAAAAGVAAAWTAGLLGIYSTLKGGSAAARAARVRGASVGADEQVAHAILADAGSHSAIVLVRCEDRELAHEVTVRAEARAERVWQGSLTEFRAALDPGPDHDWVRAALEQTRP